MPGNLKWSILFVLLFFQVVTKADIFGGQGVILQDLQGKPAFQQENRLTICSQREYLLPVAISNEETGKVYKGISLQILLPAGIQLGDSRQRKVWLINRDSVNSHPAIPFMQFATDISNLVSWDISNGLSKPKLQINKDLYPGKVILVNIGIQASCSINTSTDLLNYSYTLNYASYDLNGNVLNTGLSIQQSGNAPLNNIIATPVLLVSPQQVTEQISTGQTFKRKVVVYQTGQLAASDSFYYTDITHVPVNFDQTSVLVNGKIAQNVTLVPGLKGIQFPVEAALYDSDSIFREGDSIVVSYLVTAGCQTGEVQSEIKASWGCRGNSITCNVSTGYYAFNVSSYGYPILSSIENINPYNCASGTGNYGYTISNTGIFTQGYSEDAAAGHIQLKFDDRACTLVNYDRFEVVYQGITHTVLPLQVTGSARIFDISPVINTALPGLLQAEGDSFFVFRAMYKSNCNSNNDPACFLNCNSTCRKPYIELSYAAKCGQSYNDVFHKDNGGNNPLALPCLRPQLTFNNYTAPGQCTAGKFVYNTDVFQTGEISNVKFRLNHNGCTFYTVAGASVNNIHYPVTQVDEGWEILVPGGMTGAANEVVFDILGTGEGNICAYPDISLSSFSFCGSSNNVLQLAFSGKGTGARITSGVQALRIDLSLMNEVNFDYCTPGYLLYKVTVPTQDTIRDLKFDLATGSCQVYDIDSIAVNGKILPASRWIVSDEGVSLNLINYNISGLNDLDMDGYKDDLSDGQELSIRYYTSIGVANASPCSYPTLKASYLVCSSVENTTILSMSGKPSSSLIKTPVGYPRAGIQLLSDIQADWVSFCKEGSFQYKVNLHAVNTIYDLKFILDTRGCDMYEVSDVMVNGYKLPFGNIGREQGRILVDLHNTSYIPGLLDADSDGFKDDASIQPVYVTFITRLKNFQEGQTTCCRQPVLNLSYLLCGDFRDSISSMLDNSPYCLQAERPAAAISFKGYSNGGYCKYNVLRYSVSRNDIAIMDKVRLILDRNGCTDYLVESVSINNKHFPAIAAYQNGDIFSFDMRNVNVPVPGFIDGNDYDGKTNTFVADSFLVEFNISPLSSLLSCSYPSFSVEYGICGSAAVQDELKYSGKNKLELMSRDDSASQVIPKFISYNPPSYCDTGSLNYSVLFPVKDTIGGVQIILDTRNNSFYAIDEFRINGTSIPSQYVSRIGDKYMIDLNRNISSISGFSDMIDPDNNKDETDASFTIKAIISLPCIAGDANGTDIQGIDGTCKGPSKVSYWPSLIVTYDKCFDDKRFADTLKNSGYAPGVLLMKDDNGLPEGGISKYKTNADASTGGVRHEIYYKYSYTGIAPCPDDTQLVFRIEFPDNVNARDSIDGFILHYLDAPYTLMRNYNAGYLGHKTDTVLLSNGSIDKVVLSIFFDQTAAVALGPSSTPQEKKISFFSTGFLGSEPCDFVEFVPAKDLVNASLSFIGKDDLGAVHCRYERWCKDTLKVMPVRDIPPCPCPGEWVKQSFERTSIGFSDSTMTSKAVITDPLNQGGACDTFLLTNVLVKHTSLAFDTMYISINPAGDETAINFNALHLLSVEKLVVKDNNGNNKVHDLIYEASLQNLHTYLLKIYTAPGGIVEYDENDSLIIITKWISDISQMPTAVVSTQHMVSLFSFDEEYTQNSNICSAGAIRTPYTIIHYNTDSVKIINEYGFGDCQYKLRSDVVNNTNVLSRPDYWPREFRPMYYLDSIEVKVNGALVDVAPGTVRISSSEKTYNVPLNEILIKRDSSGSRILLKNLAGKWPLKEHAKLKGDTLYTVQLNADFISCCYSINSADSSYSFTYYYNSLPGNCSGKNWSKKNSVSFQYLPSLVSQSKAGNIPGCKFNFTGSISNEFRGDKSEGYPGFYNPSFRVDSLTFVIESLVDIDNPVTISNRKNEVYQLMNSLQEVKIRQEIAENRTYITLYNTGNWPLMIDSPDARDSIFNIVASFRYTACCYLFNRDIDMMQYAIHYTPLEGYCEALVMRDSAEVLSVNYDMQFHATSNINMLPACKMSLKADLYSDCDPASSNCYPEFVSPLYMMDSISLLIRNNHISSIEEITLGMPDSLPFNLDINQARYVYNEEDTYITLVNDGTWPLMWDTARGDVAAYTLNVVTGFGACCYQFAAESSLVTGFYFSSSAMGCKNYSAIDTIPLYSSVAEVNFLTEDQFTFEPSCAGNYSISIKRNCNGDCPYDPVNNFSIWNVDTIQVIVNGQGIDPEGAITISNLSGLNYLVPEDDITISEDGLLKYITLVNNNNHWPEFIAGSNEMDTLFSVNIPFLFTACCYSFTSADASASFDYRVAISDKHFGGCNSDMLKGVSVYHSYRNSGELAMSSSMDASSACSSSIYGDIRYICPTGNCYDPGNLPVYRIDSVKVEVKGELRHSGDFVISKAGQSVVSMPLSAVQKFIDQGQTVSVYTFAPDDVSLSFEDPGSELNYGFSLPFVFDACNEIKDDITYKCSIFYNTTDGICKQGSLADAGSLYISERPEAVMTPISGFRQQVAVSGLAKWEFDIERSAMTSMLWTAVLPLTSGIDGIRIYHIYDQLSGADSLLDIQPRDGGLLMSGVKAGKKERFRIEAVMTGCEEQVVNIYAGTSCQELPYNIADPVSQGASCAVVVQAGNKVITDSSDLQAAFILDPTVSGIKACDTLDFLLEVKNVKRGSSFDHQFKFEVPSNYIIDDQGWGFIYPFSKERDIAVTTNEISGSVRSFNAVRTGASSGNSIYEFGIKDLDDFLATNGLAGIKGGNDSMATLAIICRVYTSCDFSTPGFISANVSASTACRSEIIQAVTNTALPSIGGIDLTQLNQYSISVDDPVEVNDDCRDTFSFTGKIENLSEGQVHTGEFLSITLPMGIAVLPSVGTDINGWNWDNAVKTVYDNRTTWSIPMVAGDWSAIKFSFVLEIAAAGRPGDYIILMNTDYRDQLQCNSQQEPCKINIPTGQEMSTTIHARNCETTTLADDWAKVCGKFVQVFVLDNDSVARNFGPPVISIPPYNGSVITEGNSFIYIPDPDFVIGYDTFYYRICKTGYPDICEEAKVIIAAGNCLDLLPPVAMDDQVAIIKGTSALINILDNDYDPDGIRVYVCHGVASLVNRPEHGTVNIIGDSVAIYLPLPEFYGYDSFSYEICDADGLRDTAKVIIEVAAGNLCEMPNGFSPNGDGINDLLVVPCISSSPKDLHIWNRWGNELFFSTDYRDTWDGTYQGSMLPPGTYFYSLIYKEADGNEARKAGYIVIYQ